MSQSAAHKRACLRYEKTKNGFLMRAYRNMKSRITGIQKRKHHLYDGKELLSKEAFYAWAKADPEFHRLFAAWEDSGFDRKLSPSVDRQDPRFGYTESNMQWITHSENSRRGGQWSPRLHNAAPEMVL